MQIFKKYYKNVKSRVIFYNIFVTISINELLSFYEREELPPQNRVTMGLLMVYIVDIIISICYNYMRNIKRKKANYGFIW